MSSSGSEQGYRGPELHQGCNQVRIITLYWSGNADSHSLSWSVWISELWQVRGYCSWSIAARPRHGCSRRLQIGARAGTMFLIRVLELGLIALMISSEIVLSCRWDWILAPGSTGESQGCAVLVLTQQVSHFSIRCLFHMGKLVNLFICQLMPQSEQWAVGWAKEVFLGVTWSTLQEDYVNFLWPQVRK